jgi:hypothetical protein
MLNLSSIILLEIVAGAANAACNCDNCARKDL